MKYEKFEDIPVWIQTRSFLKLIYSLCNKASFQNDYSLMDQIRRASVSILLNLSEGFERKTNKDFARFINQSKASAGEVRCALYIAFDLGYISKEQFGMLITEIISIGNQLYKFEKYLLNTHIK
ncbi:four helix bundle protein [Patescibacteria group bacterium]|nr:four helix bundle protein [Patescibacteria group bacterium]